MLVQNISISLGVGGGGSGGSGGGGGGSGPLPGHLGLRISALEDALMAIREQLALPTPSGDKLNRALRELSRLR